MNKLLTTLKTYFASNYCHYISNYRVKNTYASKKAEKNVFSEIDIKQEKVIQYVGYK